MKFSADELALWKTRDLPGSKDIIFRKYGGFVFAVMEGYSIRPNIFEDVLQEGRIGLLVAINKFDPYLGNAFSTYAYPWIRRYVGRAIGKSMYLVSVSEGTIEKSNQFMRLKKKTNGKTYKGVRITSIHKAMNAMGDNFISLNSGMESRIPESAFSYNETFERYLDEGSIQRLKKIADQLKSSRMPFAKRREYIRKVMDHE